MSAIDSALTCFFNSWNILEDDTDDIKERKKLVIFYWSDLVVHRYTHSSEIFEDNFEQDRGICTYIQLKSSFTLNKIKKVDL